jgi:hypothetical protein
VGSALSVFKILLFVIEKIIKINDEMLPMIRIRLE